MKLIGNASFKKKDFKTAIEKFTEPISKILKGLNTQYLKGKIQKKILIKRISKLIRRQNEKFNRRK